MPRLPRQKEDEYVFNGKWKIRCVKSHILTKDQEKVFTESLNLHKIPDMTFASNTLEITRCDGGESPLSLAFTALEALKCVDDGGGGSSSSRIIKVAMSEEWLKARQESSHLHQILHKFDWTFSPFDYRGHSGDSSSGKWQPTTERIDYEKLKEKERILFYEEVILFEDELDDNGCSKLSAKIRVMPSGFFCLLRFYLRVDGTLIRVIDTRLHHQTDTNFILREYSEREDKVTDLKVAPSVWTDQNEIVNHLTLRKEVLEKLHVADG